MHAKMVIPQCKKELDSKWEEFSSLWVIWQKLKTSLVRKTKFKQTDFSPSQCKLIKENMNHKLEVSCIFCHDLECKSRNPGYWGTIPQIIRSDEYLIHT